MTLSTKLAADCSAPCNVSTRALALSALKVVHKQLIIAKASKYRPVIYWQSIRDTLTSLTAHKQYLSENHFKRAKLWHRTAEHQTSGTVHRPDTKTWGTRSILSMRRRICSQFITIVRLSRSHTPRLWKNFCPRNSTRTPP